MTVADNTSRNQYTATSGQTVFAYTFEIVDKDHIVVLQNGTALSEGTDYTVSNVGNDSGGNITLTSGATAGDVMTLYRDMPYSRTQNYTNSGDFLASEVNADFDELWLAGEQTDRSFSQSIRKPITDSDSISMELPEAATRANKFVKFDATGAVDVAGATVTVSAEDVSITDAGNYYTSGNVEGALQEVGADLTANTTKLNTIETGADVTDTANVTAAGAVMDSELTNEAAVKALNQGVATTDSPTFAGLTVDAVTYTGTDGTDGQVLMTDGAGNASFEDMPSSTYLDVKDFGATGDGTTDDTTAIQNAINHASNNEIQTIFFPDGHYKYTTLRLYHDATDNPNFQGEEASYTGDNSTTVFAYTWPIEKATDLRVKVDGAIQELTTDYTVSGVGSPSGGSVTFNTAPGTGLSISIAEANRDGRFVFLGTGKLGLSDLKNLKTEPSRIYGSILESTSGGSGIIVEPTGTFSGTDARNFRGENITFIADNTGYIITSESCPGISFSSCSFKQFNTGGNGLKIRNAWFFTMDQCFVYGPSDTGEPAVNTGDGITGGTGYFAGLWNISNSLIDSFSNGVRWNEGQFVNVSLRNTAIQNCNNYGFYAEDGVLQQLLFDNVYQENIGVRGRSFIKGTGSGISTARIRNLRMTSSFMYGPNMTGPLVDLDSVDSIDCEHLYVSRPRQTFLNVTDTKNNQVSAGKLENCTFTTDEDVANYYTSVDGSTTVFTGPYAQVATDLAVYVDDGTGSNYTLQTLTTDYTVSDLDNIDARTSTVTFTTAPVAGRSIKIIRPITLLTGIMPSVNSVIYPTVDKGFYFTADPDGSTSRRQFIRLYDETTGLLPSYVDLKATTGIAKFGFGETVVETITSSPYNISGTAGKTYYDLTHSITGGLAVYIPDTGEVNDGRLMIIKNNEASTSSSQFDYIQVYNNSDQSTVIARLSPGQAGLFVMDKQNGNKFRYAGRIFTENLDLADNHKIEFGRGTASGRDMQIYHDGTSGENRIDTLAGLTIDGLTYPTADGTSGQSIITDGSGNLTFGTAAGTGITAVVQDTTPQLGGDLESNGNDILFADNDKAIFGAGSDLQIWHSGTNSFISDNGAGNLYVGTNGTGINLTKGAGGESMATFTVDGAVTLYHDNSEKLATTSTGIDVTGNIAVSSAGARRIDISNTSLADTGEMVSLQWDANADLTFQGRASDGTFKANWYRIEASASDGLADAHRFYTDSSVERMSITSTGIDVTGSINTVLSVDGTTEDVFITGATPGLEFVENDSGGSRMRMAWNTSGSFSPTLYQSLYGDSTTTYGGINIQTRASDGSGNQVVYAYDPINDRNWWGTRAAGDVRMQLQSDGTFNVRGGDVVFENSAQTSDDFYWDASTSRLGLGTTSPSEKLTLNNGSFRLSDGYAVGWGDNTVRIAANSASDFFQFITNNTEAMRIDSSGNVGIGTASPYRTLTVSGDQVVEGLLEVTAATPQILFSVPSGGLDSRIHNDGSGNFIFGTGTNSATPTERMRIDSSGNVKINDGYLEVDTETSAAAVVRIDYNSTDSIRRIHALETGGGNARPLQIQAQDVRFRDDTTERMRIDSSGNVGIGTDAPGYLVDAQSSGDAAIRIRSTGTGSSDDSLLRLQIAGTTAANLIAFGDSGNTFAGSIRYVHQSDYMRFDTNATERMRIDSSGNLLVGTSTSRTGNYSISLEPSNSLMYFRAAGTGSLQQAIFVRDTTGTPVSVGSIATTGTATAYNISSDQRLKENIVDAPSASDDIDAIQVRSFNWKADGSHQKYGMVAQELNTVAPDAVTIPEDPEEMAGVDYSKLVPMLVKEIQSLRARVAQLEGAN